MVKIYTILSSNNAHSKSFTRTDGSRLAAAAKELGLQHSRRPRAQVRKAQGSARARPHLLLSLLLDTGTEDARMRSVFSARANEQDRAAWSTRPPLPVLDAKATTEDEEAVVPGGTLAAAILGTIKGMVGYVDSMACHSNVISPLTLIPPSHQTSDPLLAPRLCHCRIHGSIACLGRYDVSFYVFC